MKKQRLCALLLAAVCLSGCGTLDETDVPAAQVKEAAQTTESAETTEPAQTTESAETTQTAETTKAAVTTEAAETTESAETTASAKTTESAQTTTSDEKDTSPIEIAPMNVDLTDADMVLVDEAYEAIKAQNAEFAAIPREMFYPIVYEGDVEFEFCLGGIRTRATIYYQRDKSIVIGSTWDEYRDYYNVSFTEKQMNAYFEDMTKEIQEQIEAYKLKLDDDLFNQVKCSAEWCVVDGKLLLSVEHIAHTTEETTKIFECGDHAHLFAERYINE